MTFTFNRLDQNLADLNGKYRFVTVEMSDPSWSETDEDENETHHRSIDIRLSHVGSTMDDPFYTFDDTTVEEAVAFVHAQQFCTTPPENVDSLTPDGDTA